MVAFHRTTHYSRLLLTILKAQSEKHRHYHKHRANHFHNTSTLHHTSFENTPDKSKRCIFTSSCNLPDPPHPPRLTQMIIQREWTQMRITLTMIASAFMFSHSASRYFCTHLLIFIWYKECNRTLYCLKTTLYCILLYLYIYVLVVLYPMASLFWSAQIHQHMFMVWDVPNVIFFACLKRLRKTYFIVLCLFIWF